MANMKNPKLQASGPKARASKVQAPEIATSRAPEADRPYWEKPLEQLTHRQWESLCDGCGRCCLVKLEDEDTAEIHYTNIVCTLFDSASCRCGDYKNRKRKVPDCITLSMKNVRELGWLPPTCAYRLRSEDKPLAWWHPLISGSSETVHEAGISVQGRAGPSEDDIALEDYPDYIVKWPTKFTKVKAPAKSPGKGAAAGKAGKSEGN